MSVIKGILFVSVVVILAVAAFNGIFIAVSAWFGPFYQGDAEQSRNFGLWLLGNGAVALIAVVAGVILYRRRQHGKRDYR